MTVTSGEYEVIVKELAKQIAKSYDVSLVEQLKYGAKNKIAGASGFHHQIDVSLRYRSRDGIELLKLIECKLFSSKKIAIGEVLLFHSRINDIQQKVGDSIIVEGNMFTTIGYTMHAKNYASHYKIATNIRQKDGSFGSISFVDQIVILPRPATIITQPAMIIVPQNKSDK